MIRRCVGVVVLLTGLAGTALARGDIPAGEKKAAPCQNCHGPEGRSPNAQFPILAGQYADYMIQALTAYKTGARKNPIMAPFAAPLSRGDMEDLAAYYASRPNGVYEKPIGW